jgi:formate C-acetyltransferase
MGVYSIMRSMATAGDILSAVDWLVFEKKICTLSELGKALQENYANSPAIFAAAKKAPKYGCDNDFADGHLARLLNLLFDILEEESINEDGIKDVISLNTTATDMWHIGNGNGCGATPDGRLSGEPFSENCSPAVGNGKDVTALLNSAAKLPFNRIHSGGFNVRLPENLVKGEEGLLRLGALIDTYFTSGGMQLQISIASTEALKEAQKRPDEYKDLMVRITGYSAVFTDMSKKGQDEIIRRDEI